jgi:hypothetical protein
MSTPRWIWRRYVAWHWYGMVDRLNTRRARRRADLV